MRRTNEAVRRLVVAALLVTSTLAHAAPGEEEREAILVARSFAGRLIDGPAEPAYELLSATARTAVVGKNDPSGAFAMLSTGLRSDGARLGNVGGCLVTGEDAEVELERLYRAGDGADRAVWVRLHLRREQGAWRVRGADGLGFDGAVLSKEAGSLGALRAPRGTRLITGRALDGTGLPLAGARLVVLQVECEEGRDDEPFVLGATSLRKAPNGLNLEVRGARLCEPLHEGPTTFARTNADGSFVVEGLPQGLFAIATVDHPARATIVPHGTKDALVALRRAGARLAWVGRVIDGEGRPISGATLFVDPISPMRRGEPAARTTAPDGTFRIEFDGDEPFGAALARHEGRLSELVATRLDGVVPGPAALTLTIESALEIRGRLTRPDGSAYEGLVEIYVPEESRRPVPVVAHDGAFVVVPGVTTPESTVRFVAPGVGSGRADLTRKGRRLVFPDVVLRSQVTLVVTAFRADGEPAAGAIVRLLSPATGGTAVTLQLDEDGNTVFPNAVPGPAKVELLDAAGHVVGTATVRLPVEGRAAIAIQGK